MNAKNRQNILRRLILIDAYCEKIKRELQEHIDRCSDEKDVAADKKDIKSIDELKKRISGLRSDIIIQHTYACAEMLLEITVRDYAAIFRHIPYAKKARSRILEILTTIHFKISCTIE